LLYLLDANVLITANREYYPLERVPEFWEWLVHNGTLGRVKMPIEMIEEVSGGNDDLATWIGIDSHLRALRFEEEVDIDLVQKTINEGYARDLLDHEIEKLGRDPFLVSYALRSLPDRCVVTTEVSKPKKQRANRHVPDVCQQLQIACLNSFSLIRALNFSTSWRSQEP
jgi:hypothetical protein